MANVKHHKFVASLPTVLEADSIYFVRVGTGFDIYVTNSSGTIVAYPINREPVITAGTVDQFYRGDKTWQDLATTVRSVFMTGISFATAAAVLATDSLLAAIGKLQAQINSINTNIISKANAGNNSDITNLNTLATATWAPNGRIAGKFDASSADTFLQNTTANSVTRVCAIPSGTGNGALFYAFTNSNIATAGTELFRMGASGASGSGSALIECSNLNLLFNVNGAERFRVLAASPDIYINTTVPPVANKVNGMRISNGGIEVNQTAATPLILGVGSVSNSIQYFYYSGGASPVNVGSISTNGTSTAYNTSSDYRLKDEIEDATPELSWDRLDGYRIRSFVYKTQPDKRVPFGGIAHELAEANPDMVTGEKDAVEELGTLYAMRPVGDLYDIEGNLLVGGIEEPKEHDGEWVFAGTAEFTVSESQPVPVDELPGTRWEKTGERMVIQGVDWSKAVPELILNQQTAKAKIIVLEERAAAQDVRIMALEERLQQLLDQLSA